MVDTPKLQSLLMSSSEKFHLQLPWSCGCLLLGIFYGGDIFLPKGRGRDSKIVLEYFGKITFTANPDSHSNLGHIIFGVEN